jgi:hypothetical protein
MLRFATIFLLAFFASGGSSKQIPNFPDCQSFAEAVFLSMLDDLDDLREAFVTIDQYQRWIDGLHEVDAEVRDQMKLQSLNDYAEIRKRYRQECRRIHKLFADFKRQGGNLQLDSCAVKDHKNLQSFGMFTIFYSGKVKKDQIKDAVSFEVLVLEGQYHVVDGFFDRYEF